MELWTLAFRTVFFYFLILIVYRLMGKREVGQLGIIDLVVSILMAELIAISIDNPKDPILYAVIPILILFVFQIVFAFISIKFQGVRDILDGKPAVVINEGKIVAKEMLKQRYNLDDLLTQLRDKNIKSIDEVEYAVLENSGKLSVFTYNDKPGRFPMAVILDGKIEKQTLKFLKKDENWVNFLLKKENLKVDDVFYAFYTKGSLYIIKQNEIVN